MTVSAEKTEHYIRFHVQANTPAEELSKAAQSALSGQEDIYGIYHLDALNAEDAEAKLNAFSDIHELWVEQNTMAIFIHTSPELAEKFEDYGLVLVPTENEAIEYVMMDKLSKDFDLETEE